MTPLTKSGRKIERSMEREYGKKKGRSVFYATMKKKPKQTTKWHRRSKHLK